MAIDDDRRIGENLARLRGSLTQQALANEMRLRGWKWSQATVWSVEKAERPLRLAEALDVADILGCTVGDFGRLPIELALWHDLDEAREGLTRAYRTACDAIEQLERASSELAFMTRVAAKNPEHVDPEMLAYYIADVNTLTLEGAIRVANERLSVVRDPMLEPEVDRGEH